MSSLGHRQNWCWCTSCHPPWIATDVCAMDTQQVEYKYIRGGWSGTVWRQSSQHLLVCLYDAGGREDWKTDPKWQGVNTTNLLGVNCSTQFLEHKTWSAGTQVTRYAEGTTWSPSTSSPGDIASFSFRKRHCFCQSALSLWWLGRPGGTLMCYPTKGYSCYKEMEGLQTLGRKIQSPQQAHKISQSKMPSIARQQQPNLQEEGWSHG